MSLSIELRTMFATTSVTQPKTLVSIRNVLLFSAWTVTSFLCHHFAKHFLLQTRSRTSEGHTVQGQFQSFSVEEFWNGAIHAGTLTTLQIAFCFLLVNVGSAGSGQSLWIARICHVTATYFTNLSMACMFASSTFAIKLMEPITSAVVQYSVLGTPLSPIAVLSLPVIVGGAIVFSGNPLSQSNLPFGIAAAFASNIILAFRNVSLKTGKGDQSTTDITLKPASRLTGAATILIFTALVLAWMWGYLPWSAMAALSSCILSSIFHVLYSYISTGLVLAQLSVVSHAVTNILKRVLVVLLLYMTGSRLASPVNFLGLVVCTAGLFLYAWSKNSAQAQTKPQDGLDVTLRKSKLRARVWYCVWSTGFVFIGLSLGILRDYTMSPRLSSRLETVGYGYGTKQTVATPATPVEGIDDHRFSIPVWERTFTKYAHDLPHVEDMLPPLDGYSSEQAESIHKFLQEDLIKTPNRSSFLSKQLHSTTEVTNEAQRLHFDILGKTLSKFRYAMLLDIASFENKGDPCITVGEVYFLARIKLQVVYYCGAHTCNNKTISQAAELARKKYSPEELVILIHGGGNIVGYAFSDIHRFMMFKAFQGYQLFVFPQSIWVRSFAHDHFKRCAAEYCCNPNVTFVMRDHLSYSIAQEHFKGSTKYILAPDMAFQIGPVKRFLSPVFDVMWIRRGDGETPGYKEIPNPPPGVRIHVSDWWKWLTPKAPSSLEKAHYICSNGFFYLQRGRVVITDRLHGHILSTLMDIPHVLIDNKAHKLSAYHNSWTVGVNNTLITDDPSKALDLALSLLAKYNSTLPPRVPFLDIDEWGAENNKFDKPNPNYV